MIYAILSYMIPPFVSAGVVLMLFLWARKLSRSLRVALATFFGVALTQGPGLLFNVTSVGDTPPISIAIILVIYLVLTLPFAWFLTVKIDKSAMSSANVFD